MLVSLTSTETCNELQSKLKCAFSFKVVCFNSHILVVFFQLGSKHNHEQLVNKFGSFKTAFKASLLSTVTHSYART